MQELRGSRRAAPDPRDVAVAGVLGSAMLGMSSVAASVSGVALGLGLAGVLLLFYASWGLSRLGALGPRGLRVLQASAVAWLAGLAFVREASLGLGLAPRFFGSGAPSGLLLDFSAVLGGALVGSAVAARSRVLLVPRRLSLALSAAAAVLIAASPVSPLALVAGALSAGVYSFLEMSFWRLIPLRL